MAFSMRMKTVKFECCNSGDVMCDAVTSLTLKDEFLAGKMENI